MILEQSEPSRVLAQILANQSKILQSLTKLGTQMATVQADIQALTAVVTTIQGTLATVQTTIASAVSVLSNINGDNLTPADQAALETATNNLGGVELALQTANTTIQGALNPAPAPTPTPAGS